MNERGMVTEIQGKLLTVQLEVNEGCGACANDGCKKTRRAIKAYNRDEIPLAEGDYVEVQIEGKAQLFGAFWVLGLPLIMFAGGYVLGRLVFRGESEAPAALGGLGGLLLGMLIGVIVQKGQRLESLPRILRKVEPEVSGEADPDWNEGSPEYIDAASK
jgi:positive regulator of sigma E activity